MSTTYSLMDELLASPKQPLALESRRYHIGRMLTALDNLKHQPEPTDDDWKVLSTAVNMMETLIEMGVLHDPDSLHADAIKSMADAGARHAERDAPIRLDGLGIQAMNSLIRDYTEVIEVIPARTMIRAFRLTELKVQKMFGHKTKKKGIKL